MSTVHPSPSVHRYVAEQELEAACTGASYTIAHNRTNVTFLIVLMLPPFEQRREYGADLPSCANHHRLEKLLEPVATL